MIHSTAVIHPKAGIDPTVSIGPYAVIDGDVVVGPHCVIGPHVYLTGHTTIGEHNRFHAGCVIGDAPQDLKYADEPTRLRIGGHNVFREHATVHRSAKLGEETIIGHHNLLMAHCHVGHNVVVGNHVVLANGSLLSGHASVGDRAFLSGNCGVHQFVRIGTLAIMQGLSAVSLDVPPFTVMRARNTISGLNTVGLRRAGFTVEQRLELKRLYHLLFRSRLKLKDAIAAASAEFSSEPARLMLDFVASSVRGVCPDHGLRRTGAVEPGE